MNEQTLTREEAIDRMKAGLPCETCSDRENMKGLWVTTVWAHFDLPHVFRKPPEPRRVAKEYGICDDGYVIKWNPDKPYGTHVREVLPGDVVLQRMTEQEWLNLHAQAFGSACMPSALVDFARALGLIGEGS